ncbi:MAG: sigma factor-like helix-turn-helix DNA-binding protein [Candidatus Nanoarchaeia archaeon]|nr:sigma factor-like helix-turn-helix DNA-binding protein [Candidatus Nanoarchaeia archaeon]
MSEESEKLIELIKDPLGFYSSDQLIKKGFDRNYRRRLERDEFKLAKVSQEGNLSYLGGYLLGRAQKDKLGIRRHLRQKPKNYSYVCPFAFCQTMEIHPDELPEKINIDGDPSPLIERVQLGTKMQYRIPVSNMAYISLPVIEDVPISVMTDEELARRHRVTGKEEYREEFLDRYTPIIRKIIETSGSFKIALEQMGYSVLETHAKNGASQGFVRFDLTRGFLLNTYLPQRVKGEVLDYLREIDEVPRHVRTAEKKMRPFLEDSVKTEKPFDIEAFARTTGISIETAHLAHELYCRNQGHNQSLDKKRAETDSYKEVRLKDSLVVDVSLSSDGPRLFETRDGISGLLSGLDSVERDVIVAYFLEGRSLKDIGRSLELSESRMSQMIHGNHGIDGILFRLRDKAAQIFPEYVPKELRELLKNLD